MSEAKLGDRILLVDDLVDSGETLLQTLTWLEKNYHLKPQNCRTAVLWQKGCSRATPNYFVNYLPNNPWIHQPFEAYENQSIEMLVPQFQKYGSMLNKP